jgi:hypothetical protein
MTCYNLNYRTLNLCQLSALLANSGHFYLTRWLNDLYTIHASLQDPDNCLIALHKHIEEQEQACLTLCVNIRTHTRRMSCGIIHGQCHWCMSCNANAGAGRSKLTM